MTAATRPGAVLLRFTPGPWIGRREDEMAICWATRKQAEGFRWIVEAVGYQVPTRPLKSGVCATRAKAAHKAKQWALYYRRLRDRGDAP